ncbi:hypothetical protein CCH79_00010755, partial [Gambusia affinis]
TYRFKHGIVPTIISARHKPRPSHQAGAHVADNVPIQIRHHHHIKLLGFGHKLEKQRKSQLLYSPSVFSLMIMMSMFLCRVWTPGRDWQCITLAYRSKLVTTPETIYNPGDREHRTVSSHLDYEEEAVACECKCLVYETCLLPELVPLRGVVVLLLVGFTWLLASVLFGGDISLSVRNIFTAEPRPRRYKCGLSAPCPSKHLAFRLVSGAANVIGPKICLEDKMLVSSVKNNVGRGLNIALVNGVTGELLETRTFDMWAGDVSDLLKFLRPLHEGTLVFVASFDDAATKLNDESRRLFEELGSTAVKEMAFRDSWVFVGAKGIENKSPFEQRMKNSKSSNKYEGWPESLEMDGCIPLRPPLE